MGTPNGVVTRLSPKYTLYGINRLVSIHTLHLQHSCVEPTIMGPPGAPNGAPTRLSLKYTLYGINEFPLDDIHSSVTTFIWIIDPQGGPRPK